MGLYVFKLSLRFRYYVITLYVSLYRLEDFRKRSDATSFYEYSAGEKERSHCRLEVCHTQESEVVIHDKNGGPMLNVFLFF